jgi:hypothetical protein
MQANNTEIDHGYLLNFGKGFVFFWHVLNFFLQLQSFSLVLLLVEPRTGMENARWKMLLLLMMHNQGSTKEVQRVCLG